ncbi:MAG: LamG domain-containing protein [Candidatus Poribacteria bacterium]
MTRFMVVVTSFIVISLMFVGLSSAKIDPRNIMGMWLFDEGKGDAAKDSSENGNDGALMNKPKWVKGKLGGALEFDGVATYVDCGNEPSLDITKEITVMAWVQFDGLDYKNSTGKLNTIAAKGYPDALAPHAGWWFSYDNRNNKQDFPYTCFGNKKGGWAGGGNNFSGHPSTFKDGEWYHFAFTIAKSIAVLYIDGAQLGADKPLVNLVLSDTGRNLTIGSAGTNWYFDGIIDEVAIFNVALSENDIGSIMTKGLEKATGMTAVSPSGKLTNTWGDIKQ